MSLVGAVGAAALGAAALRALTTRLVFDDFELAADYRRLGWWGQAERLYRTWSGRALMNLAAGPLAALGPRAAMLFGPVTIAALWAVVTVLLRAMCGTARPRAAGALAASGTAMLVAGVPSPYQDLRWISGGLVYAAPVVLAFAALAAGVWGATGASRRTTRVAASMVVLVGSGLSSAGNETHALVTPFVCALIIVSLRRARGGPRARRLAWFALAASLAGAASLLLAPGPRARAALGHVSHRPADVAARARDGWLVVWSATTGTALLPALALVALGCLARRTLADRSVMDGAARIATAVTARRVHRISAAASLASLAAEIGVPAYTLEAPAPLRALLPVWCTFAAWCALAGWRLGLRIEAAPAPATAPTPAASRTPSGAAAGWSVVLGLLAVAGPLLLLGREVSALPSAQAAARRWSCVDAVLRAAPARSDVRVSAPRTVEDLFFLLDDASARPNIVTARYYGLRSISNRADAPCAVGGSGALAGRGALVGRGAAVPGARERMARPAPYSP